jgi:Zn-dependent protease
VDEEKKKKIYTSFHEMSPREYMYFPKGTLEMGKPGKFSRTEIIHILIAMFVLTISFSFPISNSRLLFGGINLDALLDAVPISFLGLLTAFLVHELSHKFIAQKYGLWSEFRMFPGGLILSTFLALFTGVVFAAPGAVMFRGEARTFETGKIAAAGSSANIVIAAITLPLYYYVFETPFLYQLVGFICLVNALLATFNLLPLGPLDGAKVIRWNGIVWAILFTLALLITMTILPRFTFFY